MPFPTKRGLLCLAANIFPTFKSEAAAEPEMEDDMQSFVPKKGKFIKENVKSKKKSKFTKEDIKLKEDMNDILKSVLSESQN